MNARMKRFLSVVVAGAGVGALALLAFTLLSITDTREVEACTPPTYYTLTINIEGQGSTNPASGGSYLSGATASINPTPSQYWLFDHWEGDLTGSDDPGQIVMDSNKTVTAVFVEDYSQYYTLFTQVEGEGDIDLLPDGGLYAPGTEVQLTAVPYVGSIFHRWGYQLNGTENPESITMNSDKLVKAIFESGPVLETTTYLDDGTGSLTASALLGALTTDPAPVNILTDGATDYRTFYYGTEVSLAAAPVADYAFDRWEGLDDTVTNPATITLGSGTTVGAVFKAGYTLSATTALDDNGTPVPNENVGSVTFDPDAYGDQGSGATTIKCYLPSTEVGITAVPEQGYAFDHWEGSVTGTDLSPTLFLDSDKAVTAVFVEGKTLSVTVALDDDSGTPVDNENAGQVEFDPEPPVDYGSGATSIATYATGTTVGLTAVAALGSDPFIWGGGEVYVFDHWEENGVELTGVGPEYSFDLVADRALTAVFVTGKTLHATALCQKGEYYAYDGLAGDITLDPDFPGPGTGEMSDPATQVENYLINTTVNLVAAAHFGYHFDHWEGHEIDQETDLDVDLTMDDHKDVYAIFGLDDFTLTTAVTGSGTVYSSSGQQYTLPYGTEVTLTAIPDPGWVFAYWDCLGDPVHMATTVSVDVLIDGDKTVTAVFALESGARGIDAAGSRDGFFLAMPTLSRALGGNYAVTVVIDDGDPGADHGTVLGWGTGGTRYYGLADRIWLVAVPDHGYALHHWSFSTGAPNDTNPIITFVVPDVSPVVITAHFVEGHRLSGTTVLEDATGARTESGKIGYFLFDPANPEDHDDPGPTMVRTYLDGTEVTITAMPGLGWDGFNNVPCHGYYFDHWEWTDGAEVLHVVDDQAYTLTLTESRALNAIIREGKTLNCYVRVLNPDGTLASGGCEGTIQDGQLVPNTAVGAIHLDPDPPGPVYWYTGTTSAAYRGEAVDNYPAGQQVKLTAEASPGYLFDHWRMGGQALPEQTPPNELTVTMDDHTTVYAVFSYRIVSEDLAAFLAWADPSGDPATYDRNGIDYVLDENDDVQATYVGNGIPDAAEIYLVQAVLKTSGLDLTYRGGIWRDGVLTPWAANYAQAAQDLGAQDAAVIGTFAAYMTIGNFDTVQSIIDLIQGGHPGISIDPDAYARSMQRYLCSRADADNDGASNLDEWLAALYSASADKLECFAEYALDGTPHMADTGEKFSKSLLECPHCTQCVPTATLTLDSPVLLPTGNSDTWQGMLPQLGSPSCHALIGPDKTTLEPGESVTFPVGWQVELCAEPDGAFGFWSWGQTGWPLLYGRENVQSVTISGLTLKPQFRTWAWLCNSVLTSITEHSEDVVACSVYDAETGNTFDVFASPHITGTITVSTVELPNGDGLQCYGWLDFLSWDVPGPPPDNYTTDPVTIRPINGNLHPVWARTGWEPYTAHATISWDLDAGCGGVIAGGNSKIDPDFTRQNYASTVFAKATDGLNSIGLGAYAAPGWEFDHWEGVPSSALDTTEYYEPDRLWSVAVGSSAGTTPKAVFQPVPEHTLELNWEVAQDHGDTETSCESRCAGYLRRSDWLATSSPTHMASIQAIANEPCVFRQWRGDGYDRDGNPVEGNTNAHLELRVASDWDIRAVFEYRPTRLTENLGRYHLVRTIIERDDPSTLDFLDNVAAMAPGGCCRDHTCPAMPGLSAYTHVCTDEETVQWRVEVAHAWEGRNEVMRYPKPADPSDPPLYAETTGESSWRIPFAGDFVGGDATLYMQRGDRPEEEFHFKIWGANPDDATAVAFIRSAATLRNIDPDRAESIASDNTNGTFNHFSEVSATLPIGTPVVGPNGGIGMFRLVDPEPEYPNEVWNWQAAIEAALDAIEDTEADFTASPESGGAPLQVQFTDTSEGILGADITSWTWDFGDGSPTSDEQNPVHTYTEGGVYTVSLTVSTDYDTTPATETKTDYISIVEADFSATPTSGIAPVTVTFTDASTPGAEPITQWDWDFGDGSPVVTDTTGDPVTHDYTSGGAFDVSLTVTAADGTATETKTDYISVVKADFEGMPTSGLRPLSVQFLDLSDTGTIPITSRSWSFGDGTPASTDQDPLHEYASPGDYTVSLTIGTAAGSDSETKANYIHVDPSHLLTLSVSGSGLYETTSPSPGVPHPCPVNESTGISASPAFGFSQWTGDITGSATENPTSVYMDTDRNITAQFKPLHTLTTAVDPVDSGTVTVNLSPDEPGSEYYHGREVTLTAEPQMFYVFDHWSGDAAGTENPLPISITEDTSVTAHFHVVNVTSISAFRGDVTCTSILDDWPEAPGLLRSPKYVLDSYDNINVEVLATPGLGDTYFKVDATTASGGSGEVPLMELEPGRYVNCGQGSVLRLAASNYTDPYYTAIKVLEEEVLSLDLLMSNGLGSFGRCGLTYEVMVDRGEFGAASCADPDMANDAPKFRDECLKPRVNWSNNACYVFPDTDPCPQWTTYMRNAGPHNDASNEADAIYWGSHGSGDGHLYNSAPGGGYDFIHPNQTFYPNRWFLNGTDWNNDVEFGIGGACLFLHPDNGGRKWAGVLFGSPRPAHMVLGYWDLTTASHMTDVIDEFFDQAAGLLSPSSVVEAWLNANVLLLTVYPAAIVAHKDNITDTLKETTRDTYDTTMRYYTLSYDGESSWVDSEYASKGNPGSGASIELPAETPQLMPLRARLVSPADYLEGYDRFQRKGGAFSFNRACGDLHLEEQREQESRSVARSVFNCLLGSIPEEAQSLDLGIMSAVDFEYGTEPETSNGTVFGHVVRFQHTHDGIPVEGDALSVVVVHGEARNVQVCWHQILGPGSPAEQAKSVYSSADAESVARNSVTGSVAREKALTMRLRGARLVYYGFQDAGKADKVFIPAWKFVFEDYSQLYTRYVDALTNELLDSQTQRRNAMRRED